MTLRRSVLSCLLALACAFFVTDGAVVAQEALIYPEPFCEPAYVVAGRPTHLGSLSFTAAVPETFTSLRVAVVDGTDPGNQAPPVQPFTRVRLFAQGTMIAEAFVINVQGTYVAELSGFNVPLPVDSTVRFELTAETGVAQATAASLGKMFKIIIPRAQDVGVVSGSKLQSRIHTAFTNAPAIFPMDVGLVQYVSGNLATSIGSSGASDGRQRSRDDEVAQFFFEPVTAFPSALITLDQLTIRFAGTSMLVRQPRVELRDDAGIVLAKREARYSRKPYFEARFDLGLLVLSRTRLHVVIDSTKLESGTMQVSFNGRDAVRYRVGDQQQNLPPCLAFGATAVYRYAP